MNFIQKHFTNNKDILGVYTKKIAFKGPELASIDITQNCNNSCIGCWCFSQDLGTEIIQGEQKLEKLSVDLMDRLTTDLVSMGTLRVNLSGGGDPLMHPDFLPICQMIKKKGMSLNVNTSFVLMTKRKLDFLKDIGIDHIHVSLWAATPGMYVKTHPTMTKKVFLKLVEDMHYMHSLRIKFNIYNVLSNVNYTETERMVKLAEDVGAESMEFTIMDIIPGKTDTYTLSGEQKDELLHQLRKLRGIDHKIKLWNIDDAIARLEGKTIREGNMHLVDRIPCRIGWTYVRVMSNGNVVPCCKGHNKPLGNLHSTSFRTIWYGHTYNQFRNLSLTKKKNHPYFKPFDCYRACDNVVNNKETMYRLEKMHPAVKGALKGIALIPIMVSKE